MLRTHIKRICTGLDIIIIGEKARPAWCSPKMGSHMILEF